MLDRLETKYAQTQGAAPAALGDEQAGLPQVATQSRSRMRPGSMLRRRENRGIDDEWALAGRSALKQILEQGLANTPVNGIERAFNPAAANDDPTVRFARSSPQCNSCSLNSLSVSCTRSRLPPLSPVSISRINVHVLSA